MMYAGIEVTDADSLELAADIMADVEADDVECPECQGKGDITDWSPDLGTGQGGYINIECPCCLGAGTVSNGEGEYDDWDPEPPTPAAPALAVVIPLYRCQTCRDTGRVVKPSAWFAGQTTEGFCEACTPFFDFAARRFVNCGGTGHGAGDATPPPVSTPVPFDRAAHCQHIGQTGGLTTLERHGRAHFVAIGRAGYAAAVAAHGVGYVNGLLKAKRWDGPRRPDLVADLAAGRLLADLDRAA